MFLLTRRFGCSLHRRKKTFLFCVILANDLVCGDRAACVLDQRQKKEERLLNEAIVQFRQQFQQTSSRREFDLNDPQLLKKQEGVKILPGLTGEDLSRNERQRKQQEQLRGWCIQQHQEREQTKQKLKQERKFEDEKLFFGLA